jgi:hypothetical protein
MKNWILFLLFLMFSPFAEASHLLGGEISYQCLGNGNYRFQVVVFRDCNGIPFTQTNVALLGPVGVSCNLVATYDITPRSSEITYIRCDPPATFSAAQGGIGKFVFEGTANLSSLGVAPLTGYTWTTSTGSIPCCRNSSSNSNCSGDMVLRVSMYPFIDANGTALTPAQICDNSPVFVQAPTGVNIYNTFDTTSAVFFAQDTDQADAVRFYFDNPWTGIGLPCNYTGNYSTTNPLPGMIGVGVDSVSGIIKYRPNLTGRFQTAVRAESWRCGQKIAAVFRDFQLSIITNPVDANPPYNPTHNDSLKKYQQKAPVLFLDRERFISSNVAEVKLYHGDTLRYLVGATDSFPLFSLPTTQNPVPIYRPNLVSVFVNSPKMGANGYDQNSGCDEPPCAVVRQLNSNNMPLELKYSSAATVLGYGFTDTISAEMELYWVATNPIDSSTSCITDSKSHYFVIGAIDDVSPLRGQNTQILKVEVLKGPELETPKFRQLSFNPSGNELQLAWSHHIDTTTIDPIDQVNHPNLGAAALLQKSVQRRLAAFGGIEIQRTESLTLPFITLAIINDRYQLNWLDSTIIPGQTYYYRLATVNNFSQKRLYSDTLKTVRLIFGHDWDLGAAKLDWDSLGIYALVPATFTGQLVVERENYTLLPALWQTISSTNTALTHFSEIPQFYGDSLNYRVGFVNSNGLISYTRAFGSSFDLDALSISHELLDLVRIYPNPAENNLFLSIPNLAFKSLTIIIFDLQGKKVKTVKSNNPAQQTIEIDLTDLAKGNYNLQIRADDRFLGSSLFVKQ